MRESLLEVIRQNIAGWCQQTFEKKSLLTMPSNVLLLHLKQIFPPIVWFFTEGDVIESRLPFKIFSTLTIVNLNWSTFDKFNCFCITGYKMTNSCLACASLGDKAFFGLPKNKDRRAIWVVSLKLEEWFTGKIQL